MTLRVLIAKVGLDGHDRGVNVITRLLRDAGMEVIYTGLFQTPEAVARTAIDEDVDLVGLSILSGAHLTLAPLVLQSLRDQGCFVPVVVGGIIPESDVTALLQSGIAAIFGSGTSLDHIVSTLEELQVSIDP
ncbi:MAG: cobalamin B12-binding domain-containing protein [Acidimicrobiaceae bacterium]|nr:cobalamin B12-binding domain-containing protein [Acidimicrobiaceae bacterium]